MAAVRLTRGSGWLLLALWCIALTGCAVNPVSGRSELMLLSEQDEIRLGRETGQSVTREYGVYADAPLQSYVDGVGQPLARNSHRPALPWQFKVMDSPVVNAFAAPGGYIFVTRGLLAAVNDEASLAGVLAHEIGHVTARHSARNYSQSLLAGLGVQLGTLVAGSYGDLLGPVLEAGTGLLFLKYSRDDERQADALAVEYAAKAGYDANRMADFFTTLQRLETLEGSRAGGLPEWFSTHPSPADREASVRSLAAQWRSRLPGQAFRVNRDVYLDRIDGLLYGEDPRRGYREGEWFFLPDLQVQFRIPSQWSFAREGSQAQMQHPQKTGMVLFGVEAGSVDQVSRAFLAAVKATVEQSSERTINGFPARELVTTITDGRQRLRVLSHFFQKGTDVVVFHGVTAEQEYSRLAATLAQPANSCAPLTDPTKLNRKPQRIAVKRLTQATTLQAALQGFNVPPALWPRVAWLNELRLDDHLPAGQRIKIVQ
jgi:predicted Zn-dependent protease